MGMSATRCQGNVGEFQSVWRVVTLTITWPSHEVVHLLLVVEPADWEAARAVVRVWQESQAKRPLDSA